jgi:hypothetical protein
MAVPEKSQMLISRQGLRFQSPAVHDKNYIFLGQIEALVNCRLKNVPVKIAEAATTAGAADPDAVGAFSWLRISTNRPPINKANSRPHQL